MALSEQIVGDSQSGGAHQNFGHAHGQPQLLAHQRHPEEEPLVGEIFSVVVSAVHAFLGGR